MTLLNVILNLRWKRLVVNKNCDNFEKSKQLTTLGSDEKSPSFENIYTENINSQSKTNNILAKEKMKCLLDNDESQITVIANDTGDKFYKTTQNVSQNSSRNPRLTKVNQSKVSNYNKALNSRKGSKMKKNKDQNNYKIVFPVLSKTDNKVGRRNIGNFDFMPKNSPDQPINFDHKILENFQNRQMNISQRDIRSKGVIFNDCNDLLSTHKVRRTKLQRNLGYVKNSSEKCNCVSTKSINKINKNNHKIVFESNFDNLRKNFESKSNLKKITDVNLTPNKLSKVELEDDLERAIKPFQPNITDRYKDQSNTKLDSLNKHLASKMNNENTSNLK